MTICFAILIAAQEKVADLGVETRQLTRAEAQELGLATLAGRPQGRRVTSVRKEGPADKAGIREGDTIVSLNGGLLYSQDDLDDLLRSAKPGAKAKAALAGGKEIEVTLGEAQGEPPKFRWDYAGPARLDDALAQAKKEGKLVLVGLSGAET
jgi:S1-C subfamily serine protease